MSFYQTGQIIGKITGTLVVAIVLGWLPIYLYEKATGKKVAQRGWKIALIALLVLLLSVVNKGY